MDALHIHLMFNHLPIFGVFCGLIVLLIGVIKKTNFNNCTAYILIIIASIGGIIANISGENAEHLIKTADYYDKFLMHEHEEAAEFAMITTFLLLFLSLLGIWLNFKENKYAPRFNYFMIVLAFWALTVYSRTAYLGGKIRHTELNNVIYDDGKTK